MLSKFFDLKVQSVASQCPYCLTFIIRCCEIIRNPLLVLLYTPPVRFPSVGKFYSHRGKISFPAWENKQHVVSGG